MTLSSCVARGPILALITAPLVGGAQQAGQPARPGILDAASPGFRPETDPADRALVAGLRDQGYIVGQNVVIGFRSAVYVVGRYPFTVRLLHSQHLAG